MRKNIPASAVLLASCAIFAATGCQTAPKIETPAQALLDASQKNNAEEVKRLLVSGVNVDVVNNEGAQPIHLAVEMGKVENVKALLAAGAKVDAVDRMGNQPIHLAAERGDIETAKILLAAGANVNSENKQCAMYFGLISSKFLWVCSNERWEVIQGYWDKEVKKQKAYPQPIHLAAKCGRVEMVKFLLDSGAKADAPCSEENMQPIHIAASEGNMEMVKLLLAHGAKALSGSAGGERPSSMAEKCEHNELAVFLKEQEVKETAGAK